MVEFAEGQTYAPLICKNEHRGKRECPRRKEGNRPWTVAAKMSHSAVLGAARGSPRVERLKKRHRDSRTFAHDDDSGSEYLRSRTVTDIYSSKRWHNALLISPEMFSRSNENRDCNKTDGLATVAFC